LEGTLGHLLVFWLGLGQDATEFTSLKRARFGTVWKAACDFGSTLSGLHVDTALALHRPVRERQRLETSAPR
jgi:hypothetical protein